MAFVLSEFDPFDCENMAESVTRHALNPLENGFEFLLAGVDTLDLGVYAHWKSDWSRLLRNLENIKERARGTKGIMDKTPDGRRFIHLPSGKPPNYRFHLQFAEYHLYIAITNPPVQSPNIYVSINSKTLWHMGLKGSVDLIRADIHTLGGQIKRIQPSRCDLCVDWYIPGGLTLEFLIEHKVSRSRAVSHYANNGQLETFYVGAPGAQIRLRIYDKGKEILKSGKKWFLELWGREEPENIWRVEYQFQRRTLKEMGVETLEDLMEKLGSIWKYLTGKWCSLRQPDNEKPERRTVLPWWFEVQQQAARFGKLQNLIRKLEGDGLASVDWYISHIAGCLPSYAARLGINNFNEAINRLQNDLCVHWFERNFQQESERRALMLGQDIEDKEEDNEKGCELLLFR